MATRTRKSCLISVDLVALARVSKKSLDPEEWPHYDRYTTNLGRGDFVACQSIAAERSNPQSRVGMPPHIFRKLYQAYSWHLKISLKGDDQAERRAWDKFRKNEGLCGNTNRRFLRYRRSWARVESKAPGTGDFLERVRLRVQRILGPLTSEIYDSILQGVGLGPGMTLSSCDPKRVTAPYKLSDMPTSTLGALAVWNDYISQTTCPWFFDWKKDESGTFVRSTRVRFVPGCRFTFVDKTVEEKRTIAIEPSCNVSLQLALHRYFAARLKRFGIDLADQTKNRRLALKGSSDGSLATIDLSSASDLIAFEVVRFLLPSDWFQLLDCIRSKTGQYRDSTFVLNKFSSMGNGFTFALETILFKAIVDTVVANEDCETAVYGDDIIVPTPFFNPLCRALRGFGFKVNLKKSFASGPFRESCGLDAFDGVDVRPVFPRSLEQGLVKTIELHNHLWSRDRQLARVVESWIPEPLRTYGPPDRALSYLFSEERELLGKCRVWSDDLQTWCYSTYVEQPRIFKYKVHALYFASLFHGGSYSKGTPRRYSTKLVKCTSPV